MAIARAANPADLSPPDLSKDLNVTVVTLQVPRRVVRCVVHGRGLGDSGCPLTEPACWLNVQVGMGGVNDQTLMQAQGLPLPPPPRSAIVSSAVQAGAKLRLHSAASWIDACTTSRGPP